MPRVTVIQPFEIEPMPIDTDMHRQGLAVHRRVISKAKDGSQHLDAGYNTYKKGVHFGAFAHANDEVCYIVSGEGELNVDGEVVPLRAGMFMFRPAGAKSTFACHTDMVTICMFSPPRM